MKIINLAILFSGNGGNLENIYKKLNSKEFGDIKINFPIAISSKYGAFGITRCSNIGLNCKILDYKENKINYDEKLINILKSYNIDLVILAGFMRILGDSFCSRFKALNIHPSILPLFKGANAIKESYESYMKIAGVSVHYVSNELDSGELIMQDIIYKIDGESLESFEDRIHALEYEIYPKAILKALNCKI
ncbi:phosphoribosylglycinamide formyltransferase [Helicobacter sp. MIT 14-3879]|uniref:phosphoribosylglycinamide formyltransferase n=1 Tax=Helicobacter sp. MIT 14-3879 TaxID=2040649 RepID=UPI000E1F250C|nr:phosphoribosylglycinamide formyltransferase [Helicobacter sp. MIT 14-3879]RDU62652.1 phosphoribosylglycinamide formyltransferase [Helicobacter sp. MIT 14-3879]